MWLREVLALVGSLAIVLADSRDDKCSLKLTGADGLKTFRYGVVYLREGEKFSIVCHGEGLKNEVPFWVKQNGNGKENCVEGGGQCRQDNTGISGEKKLVIEEANAITEANYTCQGSAKAHCDPITLTVYVAMKVPVTTSPSDFVYYNETSVVLSCENSRAKDMTAKWFRDNQPVEKSIDFVLNVNNTLTVRKPKANTGVYMCVFNTTTTSTPSRGFIHLEGPPNIDCGKGSKNMMQGDDTNLTCTVGGHPLPHSIIWTRDGQLVSSNMSIRFSFASHLGVSNATLSLKNLEFGDMGDYQIDAVNIHGNDTKVVKLRVKDKLAALWPFLGIVAEVIILVTIIFLYERRRMKKEAEEEQAEENNELKKPLTPTGGTAAADGDVRQRHV